MQKRRYDNIVESNRKQGDSVCQYAETALLQNVSIGRARCVRLYVSPAREPVPHKDLEKEKGPELIRAF